MRKLLSISRAIDAVLAFFAHVGAWCGMLLMLAVCIDVATRQFSLPKPFGWNATQLQESEYWLHTFLFALVIGWAYKRQAHVRIDLLRDYMRPRTKYVVEILGILAFLLTYSALGAWLCIEYAMTSFQSGEASKSTIGLTNIWIPKAALVAMFVLMGLAGISQLFKSIAGFTGALPDHMVMETLGAEH